MSFICEHWEALASLLLSGVAIGIAIYSSRKTSKEATRQIESIKELTRQSIDNTTKEVESIKELAKLHIKALAIDLDMKVAKHDVLKLRAGVEKEKMDDVKRTYSTQGRESIMNDFQIEKPSRDLKYHSMYLQKLGEISKQLEQLKDNLK